MSGLTFYRSNLTSPFKLFDGFTDEVESKRRFSPAVDLREDEKDYKIFVDLPGMEKKDVNIEIIDNKLQISGERKLEDTSYLSRERGFGEFFRSFNLSYDIDQEKIEATFSQGVLTITIPKPQKSLPKQILIK